MGALELDVDDAVETLLVCPATRTVLLTRRDAKQSRRSGRRDRFRQAGDTKRHLVSVAGMRLREAMVREPRGLLIQWLDRLFMSDNTYYV